MLVLDSLEGKKQNSLSGGRALNPKFKKFFCLLSLVGSKRVYR